METSLQEINSLYGNRLRVRVCGICIVGEGILMVRHRSLGLSGTFWSPPGGGVAFGEPAHAALEREFHEETGLAISVGEMLFVNEFISTSLHAIEIFFKIEITGGTLITGTDPEFSDSHQIIEEVRYLSISEIKSFPQDQVHNLFKNIDHLEDIFKVKGYLVH